MAGNIEARMGEAYSFLGTLYPANWQLRWGNAPYMNEIASTDEFKSFIETQGRIETVPGHVWACQVLWTLIRRVCPNLNKVVDPAEVHDRIALHDIGETYQGDTPIITKINAGYEVGKDSESEEFSRLIGLLDEQGKGFVNWLTDFENFDEDTNMPLEALVARWIDQVQGDHFAFALGKNLSSHSEIIGKVVKKRSILRGRTLIDGLLQRSQSTNCSMAESFAYKAAAKEVKEVTEAHIKMMRDKGIVVDLTELGFE